MNDLIARDRRVVWHPYTQHGVEVDPLPVTRADGAWLELAGGRRILDGISSWWATLHGHCHPRIVAAMHEQAARLDHVLFAGATHEPAVQLAERLLAVAPEGLSRVFYSDDGSTAVEVALKLVLQAWAQRGEAQRRVFVALDGAYHGDTFGAMSVGDPEPFFRALVPLLFEVRRVPADGDGATVERALADLGGRAAGVIVEPLLQGAAGMRVMPEGFVRGVRAACDGHGVPLIADEVFTGFGRTGAMFACQRAGVAPDVMCVAKGITGGTLPLAATLVREELFAAFLHDQRSRFFPHGHTFTANPIACAVALASLDLCAENDVPARLQAIGDALFDRLLPLRELPQVADVRRLGGMAAVELRTPDGDAGYLSALGPRLRAASIERGVLLRPLGDVLYALPPACVGDAEIELLGATMAALVRDVGPDQR
ncbi:MAG: adenosylmethionine--8-amino-7-oxononanoate transaminase [Planctomycetes bacterium]|nr:adenosylmethionine--8-amino-7-oxononanoate transaminase [Planctomycetota bacterium]